MVGRVLPLVGWGGGWGARGALHEQKQLGAGSAASRPRALLLRRESNHRGSLLHSAFPPPPQQHKHTRTETKCTARLYS